MPVDRTDTDKYLLHPQAETYGPFDLAFVREKLTEGAIAPTTGLTVVRDGVEDPYHSVGDLWPETRNWIVSCADCMLIHTIAVTEAITLYRWDDYRIEHLKEFVELRCPKYEKFENCRAEYQDGYKLKQHARR